MSKKLEKGKIKSTGFELDSTEGCYQLLPGPFSWANIMKSSHDLTNLIAYA